MACSGGAGEGSQLSACPGSEREHDPCRETPSLVLGRVVSDPAVCTPHLSCYHSDVLPIGGAHPSRGGSPHVTCHCCLPPGSLGPPCLSSRCWAGPRAGEVCLLGCMPPTTYGLLGCHSLLGSPWTQFVMAPAQGCDLLGCSSLCLPCPLLPDTWSLQCGNYLGGSYPV